MGDKTVAERPLLLSGAMVRAILDGRKTQTRRVAKEFAGRPGLDAILKRFPNQQGCPCGQPGDRLWVRETFQRFSDDGEMLYKADPAGSEAMSELKRDECLEARWRPAIHMPRWASRILLEITGVRVERLQDISEADALAEGIESLTGDKTIYHWDFPKPRPPYAVSGYKSARDAYKELWVEINGRESLDANPLVWVIEFKRVEASS